MAEWFAAELMTGKVSVVTEVGGWYRTPRRWTSQPPLVQYLEEPAVNDTRPPAVR
jgi:hypothetical protein